MIKRIKNIHHKSFNHYDASQLEFKRFNVLYGKNGRGKSSLIDFVKDNIKKGNLDIFETSFSQFEVFSYDEKYKNELIYSSDKFKTFYIADGVENLILEKKRLENKKEKVESLSSRIQNKFESLNKDKENLKSKIARNTREVLSVIDNDRYKTPQSYMSSHVNIEQLDDKYLLEYAELEKIKGMRKDINYEKFYEFQFDEFMQIESNINILNEMFGQTPENNAIERFKQNNDLENLAKLAFDIKNKSEEYRDKCPLCEQSILGVKLWEKLEKHFNEEYKKFIKSLDEQKIFFEKLKEGLNKYIKWINENLIKAKMLIEIDVDQKRQQFLETIEYAKGEIDKIIKLIDNKKQNPNKNDKDVVIGLSLFREILTLHNDIKLMIKFHNEKQDRYIEDIEKNIEKIKKYFIILEKEQILEHKRLEHIFNIIKAKIPNCLEKRNEQIIDIEQKLKDLDESFARLNDDMVRFNDDIKFEKIADAYYKIQRKNVNGEWFDCDEGLSEGEKTIVSIIYFVNHFLSRIEEIKECPIVFLDDPINSLDNANRDNIINYITQKLFGQKKGQFFISTHLNEACSKIVKKLPVMKEARMIFEIIKIDQESKIEVLNDFKSSSEFHIAHSELEGFLQTQRYDQINNVKENIRTIFEQLFHIYFGDYKNFTDCYNQFFKNNSLEKIYDADDLQELKHAKNKLNNDEVEHKIRFVLDIVNKIRRNKIG